MERFQEKASGGVNYDNLRYTGYDLDSAYEMPGAGRKSEILEIHGAR